MSNQPNPALQKILLKQKLEQAELLEIELGKTEFQAEGPNVTVRVNGVPLVASIDFTGDEISAQELTEVLNEALTRSRTERDRLAKKLVAL